jgi:hypothetical protein
MLQNSPFVWYRMAEELDVDDWTDLKNRKNRRPGVAGRLCGMPDLVDRAQREGD